MAWLLRIHHKKSPECGRLHRGAANLLGADFSPHGAGTRQTHFQGGRNLRTFFKLGGGLAVGGCLFLFVSTSAAAYFDAGNEVRIRTGNCNLA
jgi:hypothetical protein